MYIEEIEKNDDNKRSSNHCEGIGSSFVKLFDHGLRDKLACSPNVHKSHLKNMSKLDKRSDSVASKFSNEEEHSKIIADGRNYSENLEENHRDVNGTCEEKSDDNKIIETGEDNETSFIENNEHIDGNIELMIEEEKEIDPVDGFESDEQESVGFFGNRLKSIFIRKHKLPCNQNLSARKGSTKLVDSDNLPRIVKNIDKIPKKLKKKRVLSFVDTLLSLFVVGPLVIGQWRGIWNLMTVYEEFFPGLLCFIVGMSLHVFFAVAKHNLHGHFVEKLRAQSTTGRIVYDLVRLLYIYIFCVACNAQWRGGWIIYDQYIGNNTWIISILTVLLSVALVILRSLRNILASPFIIIIDRPERVFQFPTRYNVNTRDWSLYILDCAFSVGVVGSLVVFVWRGVWVLFELHLFPENREYSAIGSLIIGYIIVAVTFCLQPLMRYTCARLEGLARLLAADAFLLLSFLGTVNVWRGIWTCLDLWLLPDDVELSCWITHVGCFVFLVLLNCSNSILVRGVYIDAEEEEGRCVVFPCHYLRLFFKIERQKKEARRQNLVATSKEAQSRNEGNAKEIENETLLNCTNTMPTIIPAHPESFV